MPYGVPDTQLTQRKQSNSTFTALFSNSQNSLKKNTLSKGSAAPAQTALNIFNSGGGIIDAIQDIGHEIGSFIAEQGETFWKAVVSLNVAITANIDAAYTWLKNTTADAIEFLQLQGGVLSAWIANRIRGVYALFSDIESGIEDALETGGAILGAINNNIEIALNGILNRLGMAAQNTLNNAIDAIAGLFGLPTTTTPTPDNLLPIVNRSDYARISQGSLERAFGTERGCIGVVCPQDLGRFDPPSYVTIWVKSSNFWFGMPATTSIGLTNLVGNAYGTSAQKRVRYTQGSGETGWQPNSSLVGRVDGRLFINQDTDDATNDSLVDGVFGCLYLRSGSTSTFYGGKRFLKSINADVKRLVIAPAATSTNTELLDTVPIIDMASSRLDTQVLDTAFGNVDGSVGFNRYIASGSLRQRTTLWIKINGAWRGLVFD